jgi:hypothetical protein
MGLLQEMLKEVPLSSVLRERVALAEQRYELAGEKIEKLEREIDRLERENKALRALAPTKAENQLSEEAARVLVHLFRATEFDHRAVGYIARKLDMERGVLQYHLDRLDEAKLAALGSYYDEDAYWAATAEGRRYVVERRLI